MENFSINDKQDLDYDLPNFTSTKYNSTSWKLCHGTTYFLFSFGYLTSSVLIFTQGKALDDTTIFASEIANVFGSAMYFISSTIEWFHYRRGCIGLSNLNSNIKTNIDKSCKAAFHRSEVGIKYFLSMLSSMIMIAASVVVIANRNNKLAKGYSNILYLLAMMILSFSQIGKVERIMMKTKQYTYTKDKSNLVVEMLGMYGGFVLSIYYLIQIFAMNPNDLLIITSLNGVFNIIGCILFFMSALSMQYRYYITGYSDLNQGDMSVFSI